MKQKFNLKQFHTLPHIIQIFWYIQEFEEWKSHKIYRKQESAYLNEYDQQQMDAKKIHKSTKKWMDGSFDLGCRNLWSYCFLN